VDDGRRRPLEQNASEQEGVLEVWSSVDWVNNTLFRLGETEVSALSILTVVLILLISYVVSRLLRAIVRRIVRLRRDIDEGVGRTASRLLHYVVMIVGASIAVETIGFDLTALFTAGAIVAVALGFAMQTIVQNFISGVILLSERSITPHDILQVDGRVVEVEDIRIRSTIARTRDDEELIIPNFTLAQSTVTNYTMSDSHYRVRTKVGVAYSTDLDLAADVLAKAAASVPGRVDHKDPVVLLMEFGNSAIIFDVSVWTNSPWTSLRNLSTLNFAIWRALKEAGITIAFPQLDVHVKETPKSE
jgi:small-conductance mechanosensitive channel